MRFTSAHHYKQQLNFIIMKKEKAITIGYKQTAWCYVLEIQTNENKTKIRYRYVDYAHKKKRNVIIGNWQNVKYKKGYAYITESNNNTAKKRKKLYLDTFIVLPLKKKNGHYLHVNI